VATRQLNDRLCIELYHPGSREINSYVGQQESSVGKVTIHAGAAGDEEDEREVISPKSGVEDAGVYGVQAGGKALVYRY
jgi:hypothetical protein